MQNDAPSDLAASAISAGNSATGIDNLTKGVPVNDGPMTFPKKPDVLRLNGYSYFDQLYFGKHYDAFSMKAQTGFSDQYSRLRYVAANFAGLMSRVMADFMFGDTLTIDMDNNQDFIDELMDENQFKVQLYESALANSRRGDSVFKLRVDQRNVSDPDSPATIIIEETTPAIYFPTFSDKNARNTPAQDVLAWQFMVGTICYIHMEIHTPGYIQHEIYRYDPKQFKLLGSEDVTQFGFVPIEDTKVDRSLIFHIPNVRDGSGFFGTSDYFDLTPLFFALNNRISKIDNILDKHSDPILAVPPGVIDEEGKIKKESLGMFEVDNEQAGFNKPEYIVWNANLEYAFKEVDSLTAMLFMFSEISPESVGVEGTGSGARVESGRALKFKLLRTLAKRNRKRLYYEQAIKDMLTTAQDLAIAWNIAVGGERITKSETPKVDWGDGLIVDETEQIANAVSRVDAGLESRADAIAGLDDITPAEGAEKVKEIDAENTQDLPFAGETPPAAAGAPGAVPPNKDANPIYNNAPPPANKAGSTSAATASPSK